MSAYQLLCASPVFWAPPASAKSSEFENTFILYDKNDDKLVHKPEFLQEIMIRFSARDKNKDNLVDKSEMGDYQTAAQIVEWDTNKDGFISIEEIIANSLRDFELADANKDGALCFKEASDYFEE